MLASLILALLLLETVVRVLPVVPPHIRNTGLKERDHHYGPLLRENSKVFRGMERDGETVVYNTRALGNGSFVVRDEVSGDVWGVAMGDSFTEARQVNASDTYVELLEDRIGRETVNFGTGGQSPITQKRILEDFALPLEPETVVWQFYANDFRETGELMDRTVLGDIRITLNSVSVLWRVTEKVYITTLGEAAEGDRSRRVDVRGMTTRLLNPHYIEQYYTEACGTDASRRARETVLSAREETVRKGGDFVLLLLPPKAVFYSDELNVTGSASSDWNCALEEMRAFAEERGVPYVDMTPVFREEVREGRHPYNPLGNHLSGHGHRLTTQKLHDAVS